MKKLLILFISLFAINLYAKEINISSICLYDKETLTTDKNNFQLPVYKYGMIRGSSESGLNFGLMVSNESNIEEFDKHLKNFISIFKGSELENAN